MSDLEAAKAALRYNQNMQQQLANSFWWWVIPGGIVWWFFGWPWAIPLGILALLSAIQSVRCGKRALLLESIVKELEERAALVTRLNDEASDQKSPPGG